MIFLFSKISATKYEKQIIARPVTAASWITEFVSILRYSFF